MFLLSIIVGEGGEIIIYRKLSYREKKSISFLSFMRQNINSKALIFHLNIINRNQCTIYSHGTMKSTRIDENVYIYSAVDSVARTFSKYYLSHYVYPIRSRMSENSNKNKNTIAAKRNSGGETRSSYVCRLRDKNYITNKNYSQRVRRISWRRRDVFVSERF